MNELPKVFASKIEHEINNTQELFYGSNREAKKTDSVSVVRKINNIFSSPNHVYKSRVTITLNNDVVNVTIVGKTGANLITMDGTLIPIKDIKDIIRI